MNIKHKNTFYKRMRVYYELRVASFYVTLQIVVAFEDKHDSYIWFWLLNTTLCLSIGMRKYYMSKLTRNFGFIIAFQGLLELA